MPDFSRAKVTLLDVLKAQSGISNTGTVDAHLHPRQLFTYLFVGH